MIRIRQRNVYRNQVAGYIVRRILWMGFNKSRVAEGHKRAEHVSNPRENSDRNQRVLEASDIATEYSENGRQV